MKGGIDAEDVIFGLILVGIFAVCMWVLDDRLDALEALHADEIQETKHCPICGRETETTE